MITNRRRLLLCMPVWLMVFSSMQVGDLFADDQSIEFNRDIRPILANHCFACHGPDKGQRKADLRLDGEDFAKSPRGDAPPAIVPGKLNSGIILRVASKHSDLRMPPEEFGKPCLLYTSPSPRD